MTAGRLVAPTFADAPGFALDVVDLGNGTTRRVAAPEGTEGLFSFEGATADC